jgi:hypothetical protein
MGIKFLGTPIKQFDQLCNEEEIVMIEIKCFKKEEIGYPNPEGGIVFRTEKVQTGGWGVQIRSSKDIVQIDDGDDQYPGKNDMSDELREKLR